MMRASEQVAGTPPNRKVSTGNSESRFPSKRRSSRVVIDIPITVFGQQSDARCSANKPKRLR